ncbi:hypothetical protein IIA16_02875 [bacterium]|nr:hypothetical protein [bacterium]
MVNRSYSGANSILALLIAGGLVWVRFTAMWPSGHQIWVFELFIWSWVVVFVLVAVGVFMGEKAMWQLRQPLSGDARGPARMSDALLAFAALSLSLAATCIWVYFSTPALSGHSSNQTTLVISTVGSAFFLLCLAIDALVRHRTLKERVRMEIGAERASRLGAGGR